MFDGIVSQNLTTLKPGSWHLWISGTVGCDSWAAVEDRACKNNIKYLCLGLCNTWAVPKSLHIQGMEWVIWNRFFCLSLYNSHQSCTVCFHRQRLCFFHWNHSLLKGLSNCSFIMTDLLQKWGAKSAKLLPPTKFLNFSFLFGKTLKPLHWGLC